MCFLWKTNGTILLYLMERHVYNSFKEMVLFMHMSMKKQFATCLWKFHFILTSVMFCETKPLCFQETEIFSSSVFSDYNI
jgi:hypothetical protein